MDEPCRYFTYLEVVFCQIVYICLPVEVEKLQSLVIEKDEELIQLNLKLTNLDKVFVTEVKDQGTQFNYIIPVTG